MAPQPLSLRRAAAADLDAINSLIERAVDTWDLPDRVKRLVLPTYRYTAHDLQAFRIVCAWRDDHLLGVAAWDLDLQSALLRLHGLYVDPQCWHQGVGSALLAHAEQVARTQGARRIEVKAQAGARSFFEARGFAPLPEAQGRGYAHMFSKMVAPARGGEEEQ